MKKERADHLVVQQGLADSVEKAKRLIMAGKVYTEKEQRVDTAGEQVSVDVALKLKGETPRYVSRGGYKLEKALGVFGIDLSEKIMLDIGSSTGGFTDAALQNGALKCYALDVGTNQLVWKLRSDDRVIVMEQTNFRNSKLEDFNNGQPEVASIDVSFISLDKILPPLKEILVPDGDVLALVKPQFEAFKEEVGKKGVVKDPQVHEQVLLKIFTVAEKAGYTVCGLDYSPITGGEGNIEYLMHLKNRPALSKVSSENIHDTVKEAHLHFYGHLI